MKPLIYFFFSIFFLLTFLSSGVIDTQDGFQYLAVARNMYYTGKPTSPVYEYNTRKNIHMNVDIGKDGNTYGATGLGYSVAYLPAVFVTDMVYKIYDISPSIHFPLENDWLILLSASFTNAFFGALLTLTIFLYLLRLGLNKNQALLISLIGIFSTNLLVYTKSAFAHMMFVTFIFLSFYFVRNYFEDKNIRNFIFSGMAFGIASITYNQSFLLAIIPLCLYYLLLAKFKFNRQSFKNLLSRLIFFFVGILPFIIIYFWYENLRAGPTLNFTNPVIVAKVGLAPFQALPLTVLFEGLYGQLLSPGRSLFIYSPILLTPLFFWHKIRKKVYPELLVFILFSFLYIGYFATLNSYGGPERGIAGFWHGESSWGPRYLTILIPFGILIVGSIYIRLSKAAKLLIFLPLVLLGFLIEMLGVLVPFQTKYANLDREFYVNHTEYTSYVYSNLLPRYSPVITMSKNLFNNLRNFPKTFNHGQYNVRFYDGIDLPFNVGPERWRTVEGKGYISFDNPKKDPIREIAIGLINHPIAASSESARIKFSLNNNLLQEGVKSIRVASREAILIPLRKELLKENNNQLVIDIDFKDENVLKNKKQILAIQFFDINGQRVNLESINVPYVSPLGPKIAGVTYQNWGGDNKDPWRFWDLHTQTFERLPDLWWIRNLYYWDIPKPIIAGLLIFNLIAVLFTAYKFIRFFSLK